MATTTLKSVPLTPASCAIDHANKRAMASAEVVNLYAALDELTPAERTILNGLEGELRGQPILDIGVGGGRTVAPLRAISDNYVGIDYMPAMVSACRRRFAQARFEIADARDLSAFDDGQFKLVLFSSNGRCMVGHEDRMQILREASRVLADDGVFVFSTYNQRSADHAAGFVFPQFIACRNPARLAWRAAQFVKSTIVRIYNRRRLGRYDVRGPEYSVINDRCHDYATMLYYVDIAGQRRQLEAAGFRPDSSVYGMNGLRVDDETTDSSLTFVARKRPASPLTRL